MKETSYTNTEEQINRSVSSQPRAVPSEDPFIVGADAVLNHLVDILQLKKAFRWWLPKSFHSRAVYQFDLPHSYQLSRRHRGFVPAYLFRHLDVFHRKYEGLVDDQFLDPLDGRVRRLIVQATGPLYDTENDTTWRRTYVRNVSPKLIRLAWWPFATLPYDESEAAKGDGIKKKINAKKEIWATEHWTKLGLLWLPTCVGLLVLVSLLSLIQALSNDGR